MPGGLDKPSLDKPGETSSVGPITLASVEPIEEAGMPGELDESSLDKPDEACKPSLDKPDEAWDKPLDLNP